MPERPGPWELLDQPSDPVVADLPEMNSRLAYFKSLAETMRTNQQLMLRVAEAQSAIGPTLQRISEQRYSQGDDVARAHLRNIELYLQRLLTDAEQGRAQSTAELRNDLRILTRTVAALADDQR